MANALVKFDPAAMPAHIAEAQQDGGNIVNAISVNKLTYQNKIWAVNVDGVKTPIMMTNNDGDEMPRPYIPVIIIDYAKKRGRAYFLGGFDPKKIASPVCWSEDGVAPDPKAPGTPKDDAGVKFATCAECPMSVKGSKIDERNKETYACASHRRLVVALRGQPDFPPLQLQIGITADYDATSTALMEKNQFAFTQYLKYLTAGGIKYTASVVTRLRFDTQEGVTWPKVMFEPVGYATPDEQALYKPMAGTPEIEALMHPEYDAVPATAAPVELAEAPIDGPVIPAAKPAAKPAAAKPAAAKPAAAPVAEAKSTVVVVKKKQPPPPPVEEPVVEEPAVEYRDEDGNLCDEDGNPLVDTEPEGGEAPAAEDDGGVAETTAQQRAREAQERIVADQAKKNAAAKVAAGARRNAAAQEGAGEDEGDTIAIPKAVAANKAPATKPATVVAAKAGTAAAKPAAAAAKPVSGKTSALLQDWKDD